MHRPGALGSSGGGFFLLPPIDPCPAAAPRAARAACNGALTYIARSPHPPHLPVKLEHTSVGLGRPQPRKNTTQNIYLASVRRWPSSSLVGRLLLLALPLARRPRAALPLPESSESSDADLEPGDSTRRESPDRERRLSSFSRSRQRRMSLLLQGEAVCVSGAVARPSILRAAACSTLVVLTRIGRACGSFSCVPFRCPPPWARGGRGRGAAGPRHWRRHHRRPRGPRAGNAPRRR